MPWRYDITGVEKGSEEGDEKESEVVNADVINIAGTSRMTRNGRMFSPEIRVTNEISQGPAKETTITLRSKECDLVKSNEVAEFFKLIKKSDYKVVDQLHQTLSKISILSLLLNSAAHKDPLLKAFAQVHVTQSITVDQCDGVVSNITACNTLSFRNEELLEEGQYHNRSLHILVKCQDDVLARVLMDTGSSLNVISKSTLTKLSFEGPSMKPSALVVKAFDGSKRTITREVELLIQIGLHVFSIAFQVMDINPAYTFLL